jgi:hypothetical protein
MALVVPAASTLTLLVRPKNGALATLTTPDGVTAALDLQTSKEDKGFDEVDLPTVVVGVHRVIVRRRRAGRVRARLERRDGAAPTVLAEVDERSQWTVIYEVTP